MNDEIFVIGGYQTLTVYNDEIWKYNIFNHEWTLLGYKSEASASGTTIIYQ